MKKLLLPTFAFILLGLTTAWPAMVTVFSDDFESGTLANWTTTSSSPLTISTAHNIIPSGGLYSAMVTLVSNRMHRNIIADNGGVELDGHSIFTAWIYDPGAA